MDVARHMTPDEFRRSGHAIIERIARYMEEVERYPVLSQAEPGSVRARLPVAAPEQGEPFEDLLRDVDEIIVPGLTHWQSPNFYAFFPANASGPSILGDLLSSGFGVQGMLWATSPACTELETHVLDWLVDLLGLPEGFRSSTAGGGVIQDSASSSTLTALIAARERASAGATNRHGVGHGSTGVPSQRLIVYTSCHAHSSIEKGVKIAGLGRDNLRLVDADERYAMRVDALEAAIAADRAAGAVPAMVCATVGTTSSCAVDPLRAIGEVCRRENVWLHVDAAHAGSATVCPEHRGLIDGLELADSYTFNPHKWLLTNFDCSCFWVADRAALIEALSVLPEYLRNRSTESGTVIDYRDWQVPLGRRFRALKLWFVIRHYGAEGLRAHVRHCIALAEWFAAQVEASEEFELAAPVSVGLVCFRHSAGDAFTETLMNRLNRSGALYLTHTILDDQLVLRLAIGLLRPAASMSRGPGRASQTRRGRSRPVRRARKARGHGDLRSDRDERPAGAGRALDGTRSRCQDHGYRGLRRDPHDRDGAHDTAAHQAHARHRGPAHDDCGRRDRRHRGRAPDQHGRERGAARAVHTRHSGAAGGGTGAACRLLGRALVHRRGRAPPARRRSLAPQTGASRRSGGRGLHLAGSARPDACALSQDSGRNSRIAPSCTTRLASSTMARPGTVISGGAALPKARSSSSTIAGSA